MPVVISLWLMCRGFSDSRFQLHPRNLMDERFDTMLVLVCCAFGVSASALLAGAVLEGGRTGWGGGRAEPVAGTIDAMPV